MSLILCKKKSLQMRAKSRTKASLSLLKQGMKKSQIYLKEIGTYLPLVTLENEQQKSCWSKVQCSAFENPEHKDPQRILFQCAVSVPSGASLRIHKRNTSGQTALRLEKRYPACSSAINWY